MQQNFATTAAQTDIRQVGAARWYETKNWNDSKMKDLPRKKVMFTQDYNKKRRPHHGPEQWTGGQDFQKRTQNYTKDRFGRNSPTTCQNFSPKPNFTYGNNHPSNGRSHDQRWNKSFHRSDENRSRNESFNKKIETGETMEDFFLLNQLKGESFHKIFRTASRKVISLTILPSAGLTIDIRLV